MKDNVVILIAEDNKGHFILTKHCLRRGGLSNDILWLEDGQQTLDFLYGTDNNRHEREAEREYVLLLDIRMPKVDGIKVLEHVKTDADLKAMPVIMVTTSDSPANIEVCNRLGCDAYAVKPLDESLAETVKQACLSA